MMLKYGLPLLALVALGFAIWFVVKYDPAGTVLWSRSHDSPSAGGGFDLAFAVAVDAFDNVLAGGISTALVTTFEGLTVAIPMTALYAIFRNRVVKVIMEIGGITEELMSRFKTPSSK